MHRLTRKKLPVESVLNTPDADYKVAKKNDIKTVVVDTESTPPANVVRIQLVTLMPVWLTKQFDHLFAAGPGVKVSPFQVVNHACPWVVSRFTARLCNPYVSVEQATREWGKQESGQFAATKNQQRQCEQQDVSLVARTTLPGLAGKQNRIAHGTATAWTLVQIVGELSRALRVRTVNQHSISLLPSVLRSLGERIAHPEFVPRREAACRLKSMSWMRP